MIRAFIAIAIPDEILIRCQELGSRLQKLNLRGKFSRKESMHLTLQFLGNLDEKRVPDIAAVLSQVSRRAAPFQVSIQGLGVFPNLVNARVVWVGVGQSADLYRMQSEIARHLEALGFPGEARDFKPHLTLARLKSQKNLSGLSDFIAHRDADGEIGSMQVREVHLYQSILRPTGAEYRQLVTVRLGSGSSDIS